MRTALLEIFRLKKTFVLAIVPLALLTAALFIIVDVYQEPKIAAAQLKWSGLRRQVAFTGRGDVSAIFRQGAADLERLRTRIPPKRQFPRLLGEILEQAASCGVTTGSMTYKPHLIRGESLLTYELTMAVSGSYAAVKNFLADLRNNRELVVVNTFSLTNSDLFEENLTMDLHLTIYLREDA